MLCKSWEGDFTSTDRKEFDPTFHVTTPAYEDYKFVINCIGMIKPYCDNVPVAIEVNALFPHELPSHTIQIATDCVFSGRRGNYVETDPHDALDVYGKTKSLGEAPHIKNLRCSIIGPELKTHSSLYDWVLAQKGEVNGYTNHLWNGITTLAFSRICQGIIKEKIELPNIQHIVPATILTKAHLVNLIAWANGHQLDVVAVEAEQNINRVLSTNNHELNDRIWRAAGYDGPPTIEYLVKELALSRL